MPVDGAGAVQQRLGQRRLARRRRGRPGRRCGSCPVGKRLHRRAPSCGRCGYRPAPAEAGGPSRRAMRTGSRAGTVASELATSSRRSADVRRPLADRASRRASARSATASAAPASPPTTSRSSGCVMAVARRGRDRRRARSGSACLLLVLAALPDLLDGAVAKASGTAQPAGRVLRLGGRPGHRRAAARRRRLVPRADAARRPHRRCCRSPCSALSMLISYERAKAESLGFDAKGGLMERAERIIAARASACCFDSLLVPMLWVMLVLTSSPRCSASSRCGPGGVAPVAGGASSAAVAGGSPPRRPRQVRQRRAPAAGSLPHPARRPRRRRLSPVRPTARRPHRRAAPTRPVPSLAQHAARAGASVAAAMLGAGSVRRHASPGDVAWSSATCAVPTRRCAGLRLRGRPAAFDSYARYWVESFRLPGAVDGRAVDGGFPSTGFEYIDDGWSTGERRDPRPAPPRRLGVGRRWLADQGLAVTVVVEPLDPPELFEWFAAFRRSLGMTSSRSGPDAGTAVLRALRANEVVCLLCDRDIDGGGVEVEFFGERTTLPGGPGDPRPAHRRAGPADRGATSPPARRPPRRRPPARADRRATARCATTSRASPSSWRTSSRC